MTVQIALKNVSKTYPVGNSLFRRPAQLQAVVDLSLTVERGTTFGLVGESGSGKSTTARMIMGAESPTGGSVEIDGRDISRHSKSERFEFRRFLQPVLQDPYSSLSPRMSIGSIIGEPLEIHGIGENGKARRDMVSGLLQQVGLPASMIDRFPNELSGGQRQRVAIARALALRPGCIVLDEPVSALDVSIQAQVLMLLKGLQQQTGVTYFLISHDLAVVSFLSDTIGVLYLGRVVEIGPRQNIVHDARHPYTLSLIAASSTTTAVAPLQGEIPSPMNVPSGCAFHTRCPMAQARCSVETPVLAKISDTHSAACHFSDRSRAVLAGQVA